MQQSLIEKIAYIILFIGGINIGLTGITGYDFLFLGFGLVVTRTIYILIGAVTLYLILVRLVTPKSQPPIT